MTLRKKTILITNITFFTLFLIIFIISKLILLNGVKDLQEKDVRDNVHLALNALADDIDFLDTLAGDHATWDDSCDFINNGNLKYINSNFVDETFQNSDINIVMMINLKGEIVYSKGFDLDNKKEMTISDSVYKQIISNTTLYNNTYNKSAVSGILSIDGNPLIISSHPIVKSDSSGPVFGTMIMGSFLNTAKIDKLSKRMQFPLTMHVVNKGQMPSDFQTAMNTMTNNKQEIFVQSLNQKNILGYAIIKDISNNPSIILKMEQPMDIYNSGLNIIYCFFLWLLGMLLIFTLLVIFFFNKMIVSRLTLLSSNILSVGKGGELSARVEISGNDEIVHLASAVNEMLQTLEYYHNKLEDKELRLRLITDNMMDIILQVDNNGIITYASPSTQHLLGYHNKDMIGKKSINIVHKNDIDKIITNLEEIKSCGSKRFELRLMHKDGHSIWIETIGKNLLNENNECIGIIYSNRDITKKKLVEDELREAYIDLEMRVEERTSNLLKVNEELFVEIKGRKSVEEALQYQVEFEKLIAQISTKFINLNVEMIDEAINKAMKTLGEFVGADRCYVFLFNDESQTMDNTHEWCREGITPQIHKLKGVSYKSTPWWMQKLSLFENIIISRVSDLPIEAAIEKEIFQKQSIQSLVVVPIVYAKSLIGYLGFDWVNVQKDIATEHLTLLTIASEIFVNALKHNWNAKALATQKEQLSVTLRSISDGVISIDIDGKIVFINKAAEIITGWTNQEVEGKLIVDILKIIDSKAETFYCDEIKKMLNCEKVDTISYNNIFIRKDDTKKVITYSSFPMLEKDNKIIGFVLVLKDITEQKKYEDRLALSRKMESIGVLAAGIAHEINTPMQYIGDNTRFLRDALNDLGDIVKQVYSCIEESTNRGTISADSLNKMKEKTNEVDLDYLLSEIPVAIEQSLVGIERVSKLVLTLKDFAHPGSKEKKLSDINRAINGTSTISRNEWRYVCDMEIILDENIPFVYCVIDEINQVILNMIINATHSINEAVDKNFYTRGKITVTTKTEQNFVKIIISDNGVGIPQNLVNLIYDPFFTTKEVGKGTGQGLAISHDIIVNKHNGLIEVESEEGKGATFTISLPLTYPSV